MSEQTRVRVIRICRNPYEPFYWHADSPDEPCPGEGCEDGPHETYAELAPIVEGLRELRRELRAGRPRGVVDRRAADLLSSLSPTDEQTRPQGGDDDGE